MGKKTAKFVSTNCSNFEVTPISKLKSESLRVRNESQGGGREEGKGKSWQEAELMDWLLSARFSSSVYCDTSVLDASD